MAMKDSLLKKIKRFWKRIVGVALGLAAIFAVLDYLQKWGVLLWLAVHIAALVVWLDANWQPVTIAVLALTILYVFQRLYRLEKHSPISYSDNLKSIEDLRKGWHFEGGWTIPTRGELRVTQSPAGGITRVGQLWTDYNFEFTAVLESECIGWIVRAQDLSNYYMIQLWPDNLRPHLRYLDQWIYFPDIKHGLEIRQNRPIRIRTEVRNIEVRVYVDDQEIYANEKLLGTKFIDLEENISGGNTRKMRVVVPAFSTGRVGFRQAGNERARFSKCRVRPL